MQVRRWPLLALFAAIFLALGIGAPLVMLSQGDADTEALVGFPLVFGGVGLIAAWHVRGMRADEVDGLDELAPVAVPSTPPPPGGSVWTEQQVAAEVARAFSGTPYDVLAAPGRIRVQADLADARFASLVSRHRVRFAHTTDVVTRAAPRYVLLDAQRRVEWVAGPDGDGRVELAGGMSMQGGRIVGRSFRKEYAVTPKGRKLVVDYDFSTSSVHGPLREVLDAAGWQARLGAEARGALVIAAIGASSVVIVPLAFLVQYLARG